MYKKEPLDLSDDCVRSFSPSEEVTAEYFRQMVLKDGHDAVFEFKKESLKESSLKVEIGDYGSYSVNVTIVKASIGKGFFGEKIRFFVSGFYNHGSNPGYLDTGPVRSLRWALTLAYNSMRFGR